MHHRFRVLGSLVELTGPEEAIAPIAATYARFAVEPVTGEIPARTVALDPEAGEITSGSVRVPLLPDLPPTLQAYQQFLLAILDQVARYTILHAAAVETPGGEGVVIAGPSGHGKSSLTQELVRRGCRFLSDDYAPVDTARSTVTPYLRTIGIEAGGSAPVPPPIREAADSGSYPVLLGKAQIDPAVIRGEDGVALQPVPLRHVLLLTSNQVSSKELQAWDRRTDIHVACDARHRERLEVTFLETPGVTIRSGSLQPGGSCFVWQLTLDANLHPAGPLAPVLEDPAMVLVEKVWGDPPRFDAAPTSAAVPLRVAAAILTGEVMNRRQGGALMERYGGDNTLLFLDIAGALKGVRCHHVQVGRFDETAARIGSLIGLTDVV